jgi:hypothetical protein
MRIAQSALMGVLLVTISSVSSAQVVVPYTKEAANLVDRLDHAVPVATVIRSTDTAIALPELPHSEPGDGFFLGAAKLDLKNPDRPMIAFTMTNAAQTPMSLNDVIADIYRVNSRAEDGRIAIACMTGPWLGKPGRGDTVLPPGTTVSVEVPIAPRCGPGMGETVGFLVYLRSNAKALVRAEYEATQALNEADPNRWGPSPQAVEESAFLHKAYAKFVSLSQQ